MSDYVFRSGFKRFIANALDFLLLIFTFRKADPLEKVRLIKPRNILVIRLDRLGDILLTVDFLLELKNMFRDANVKLIVQDSLASEVSAIFSGVEVIGFQVPWYRSEKKGIVNQFKGIIKLKKLIAKIRPDIAIDPRSDARNILAMWLAHIKLKIGFGITGLGPLLDICCKYPKEQHLSKRPFVLLKGCWPENSNKCSEEYSILRISESKHVLDILNRNESNKNKPLVCLHLFSGSNTKKWPIERFAELADWFLKKHYLVALIGKSEGIPYRLFFDMHLSDDSRVIDFVDRLNLSELAFLLEKTKVVVSADSGPAHLAALVGTENVFIIGHYVVAPNEISHWIPLSGKSIVKLISSNRIPQCSPCNSHTCQLSGKITQCSFNIGVDQVIDAVEESVYNSSFAKESKL